MTMTTPSGIEIPLSTVLDTSVRPGTTSIRHTEGDRVASATADVDGVSTATIFTAFEERLDEISIPSSYTVKMGGEAEDVAESFRDLFKALFLGLFLIATILLLQFNSYRQPMFILVTLPLALIGVLPGLTLTRQALSFPAFIGIVALSGVVVNDAIILIDKMNDNRRKGMSLYDAVMDASISRMQPVLLTTITTVAGILPLALSDPIWGPLGFSMVFGLLFATVLTLAVIPMLYLRFAEKRLKKIKKDPQIDGYQDEVEVAFYH